MRERRDSRYCIWFSLKLYKAFMSIQYMPACGVEVQKNDWLEFLFVYIKKRATVKPTVATVMQTVGTAGTDIERGLFLAGRYAILEPAN